MDDTTIEESGWLARLKQEQLDNYGRLTKLNAFLEAVDVDTKVSPQMLLLLRRQAQIMAEYDTVLCKRVSLADIEAYIGTFQKGTRQ